MLTFEEIKEIAKKVAMERAKTDNVNVWYIRKLGDWYYFLYKQSGLPKWTGIPSGIRIDIKGKVEVINDFIIRSIMMQDENRTLIKF